MRQESDVLLRFGETLRKRRLALGLSQEEFADRCGLDRTYISGIERGRRNVGLRNLHLIAIALGLTVSQFLEGVE
jgi:transcriptional regulator with XRE-family HTH domain